MSIKNIFPLIKDLKNYNKSIFKSDLSAGLTVGLMLIPQGMAYAMLAGLPPIYGLYASTLPLIIYALLGTSRQLAVGPVAMVSLLIVTGVSTLAVPGSAEFIEIAILLALMVGIIQTSMGLFKLGILMNFLSHPVISGFTSAAALIIGLNQLKHLLGIDLPRSNYVHIILLNTIEQINELHLLTFIIGVFGILIMTWSKRKSKTIPGPLIVLVLGILIVYIFGLHENGLKIVGDIPQGLPSFTLPIVNQDIVELLIPIALTISFVGAMESLAVAKVIQTKHNYYKLKPNSELIALGLANVFGSFLQAFPTTGGFSRTAVNDQAGGKTTVSSLISALLIILTLLFFTSLFYYLPQTILASVIMVAVFGLIDIKEAKYLWRTDRSDFFMLAASFLGTLFVGIVEGIIIGVSLSMAMIVFRSMTPSITILGKIEGSHHYKDVNRFENAIGREDCLILRFDSRINFTNVNFFREKIEQHFDQFSDNLKLLIIQARSINSIDSSGVKLLFEILIMCENRNVEFLIVGLKDTVKDNLGRTGFLDTLGSSHFYENTKDAIDAFDHENDLT